MTTPMIASATMMVSSDRGTLYQPREANSLLAARGDVNLAAAAAAVAVAAVALVPFVVGCSRSGRGHQLYHRRQITGPFGLRKGEGGRPGGRTGRRVGKKGKEKP